MPKQLKRVLVLSAGVFFTILGLVGLVLPILQGFLFLALGLILLTFYSTKARNWSDKHTRKIPKFHAIIEQMEKWVVKKIGHR